MEKSILTTIKKLLGLDADDTSFDMDVIVHINAFLMNLSQIGVGPSGGFSITGYDETWEDFLPSNENLMNGAKLYLYLGVKSVFDPSSSSTVSKAAEDVMTQIAWRLNVESES